MSERREPVGERPDVPEGYLSTQPLPWHWARLRLERARNYWVCSVTRAGRPHARPVWGAWLDDAFWFSTGSRMGIHIGTGADVSVHLESGDETVIVEGRGEPVGDEAAIERFLAIYNPKYVWEMKPADGGFYVVRPRVVFGWKCDGSGVDGGGLFGATATRWRF